MSFVRPCHNTRNFCKFCKTFIPVPGTPVSSVGYSYPYPELLRVLYTPCHNTRGTGAALFVHARNFCEFCTRVPQYPELLEVLQPFHTRTRNFWKFCRTPIPLPGIHKPTGNLQIITLQDSSQIRLQCCLLFSIIYHRSAGFNDSSQYSPTPTVSWLLNDSTPSPSCKEIKIDQI